MLELPLELMNPRSLKQNGFWHSEASLLWKSPGFCVQDRARTPSSCLLQLLWLTSTAQVTGDWIFTDDGNRFATLVTDARKTTSYLTDISTFTAKDYPPWACDMKTDAILVTQQVREDRPQLTRALSWLRCTDSSLQTAEFPQIKITIVACSNTEGSMKTLATTQSPAVRARQKAWWELYQNRKSGLLMRTHVAFHCMWRSNVNMHILHPTENVKLHWPRRCSPATSRGLAQTEIAFSVKHVLDV